MSSTDRQIFVTTVAGKQTAYALDPQKTTVKELMRRVEEKEGYGDVQIRLIYGGKDLTVSPEKTLSEFNVQHLSTIHVVFRMLGGAGGGEIDKNTLWEVMCCEITDAIQATAHKQHACAICMDDVDVPCVKACCIWVCDTCLVSLLKMNDFSFTCTVCKQATPVEQIVTHDSIIPLSSTYRDTVDLLKNIDVQLCRCGARVVNESMYPQQQCPVCKRIFCFFCNEDWDRKKMKPNQKYGCSSGCALKLKMGYELIPFSFGKRGDKIPNRRMCPKCTQLGAYDSKCKYHTCQCKHRFCFFCLRSEGDCKASGSSYGVLNCTANGKPAEVSIESLPRLVPPS